MASSAHRPLVMDGPFVDGGGMPMGAAMGADMERWFEDYEWSICWDFEMNSWGSSKPAVAPWQPQQQPAWMMPMGMPMGAKGSGPPGPPPGPPPGAGWGFPDLSGKGNSWGAPGPSMDGPYIGDANSGDQDEPWGGGGGGWQGGGKGGKGGSQSWGSKGGRGGGKDWSQGPFPEDDWQGSSSWKQDSWNGGGKGKGSGKKGADDGWANDDWGKGGKKGEKGQKGGKKGEKGGGGGKDSWQEEPKGRGRGEKKGEKGGAAQWKPRDARDGSATGAAEADGDRTKPDKAQDDVMIDIDDLVEKAGSNLEKGDFDFRVRRYLFGLRNSGGRQKVKDALAMIQTYTAQKTRASVKNWPAYLLTLLKKFEPEPFTKQKGKGKGGNDREQDKDEARPAPTAANKKAAAPVAAGAGAAAAPGGDGDVEVVQATEELPPSPALAAADPPRASLPATLPPGWEDGRSVLHEEIRSSLAGANQTGGALRNPFTSEPLDIEATLVSNVVSCLRSPASQPASHHLVGFARSHGVVDFPRAAAAVALVGGSSELAALPDDASAMDAVVACTAAGAASTAATVLQEIALELTAEVLRKTTLSEP